MLRFHLVAISSVLLLAAQPSASDGATTPPEVVAWVAAAKARPFRVEELFVKTDAYEPPHVVIVGRAFAGTAEIANFERTACVAAKDRDIIAIDAGLTEVEAADRFVHTGEGSVKGIVANCGAFGWSRSEAESLLRSLRAQGSKATLVGIGVGDPRAALEEMLAYLRKVYPEGAQRADRVLSSLRGEARNGVPRYFLLDENERTVLRYGIDEVTSVVTDQAPQFISVSSAAEHARCVRLLASLRQYEMTMRFERDSGDNDPHGSILAENASAALSSKGETSRLLALVNVRDLARASDPDSFAAHLAAATKLRPFCIATACGEAAFRALDPNDHGPAARSPRDLAVASATSTALESALSAVGAAHCFDLRAGSVDTAVTAWLKTHRALRSARSSCGGASETPWDFAIAEDFDALAWFPKANASAQ